MAPRSRARAATAGSSSWPDTYQPFRRSRRPTDPPINPVPTTAARRAVLTPEGRPAGCGPPRGRRGAVRGEDDRCPGGSGPARTVGCCPRCCSSWAQIRGTSPRPKTRAAVAGNIETRSGVAVRITLTRSSCSIVLRSNSSSNRATTRTVICSAESSSSVVAPRSARIVLPTRPRLPPPSRQGWWWSAASAGRRVVDRGPLEGADLVLGQRAPLPRRQRRVASAGRSGSAPGVAPGRRPPRTCAGPAGCDPRG